MRGPVTPVFRQRYNAPKFQIGQRRTTPFVDETSKRHI